MKKINPYSLAVLVLGVITFTGGLAIVHDNSVEVNKIVNEKNTKIRVLESQLDEEKDTTGSLKRQNDIMKKKIDTYMKNVKSAKESQVKPEQLASRDNSPNYRSISVIATAYTAFCNTGCTGITATGYNVSNTTKKNGMKIIAVDPDIIPLHSIVKVQTKSDTFYAVALDTGGAIDGHRIDVLVGNKSIARDFGVQKVTVTILREGDGKKG